MKQRSRQELGEALAWHRAPGDCQAKEGRFDVPGASLAALGWCGSTSSTQEPGQSKADGRRGEHVPSPEEKHRNLSEWLLYNIIFLLGPWEKSGVIFGCQGVALTPAVSVPHSFQSQWSLICIWVQNSSIKLGFFRWFEMMIFNSRTPQFCSTPQWWESPSYQLWGWKSFLRLHWAFMTSGCRRSHGICRHWQDCELHVERCRVYNWCKQHQFGLDFLRTWLVQLLTYWVTHDHQKNWRQTGI